MGEMM